MTSSNDIIQQPLALLPHRQDIGPYLLQRPHRLGFVEVAVETDLVAGLHARLVEPGVRCVGGEHLAAEEGLDVAFFQERYLLGVTKVAIRLIFHNTAFAVDDGLEEPAERVRFNLAGPVDLFYYRRGGLLVTLTVFLERLDLFGIIGALSIDTLEPQGGRSTVTFQ
ncbi:hypothetical protein [Methanoculleus chikugoensis]|uniref:hypothetical protein n=1 Tax=Methanoculleus chikugoensis TaxID=118126 RepID=UPI001FB5249E|nr:hypothetical protein [Methanoculleus chikugoensis]